MNLGDTLPNSYINNRSLGNRVSEIDSVLVGPSYCKQFILENKFSYPASIIEGIGSSEGVFNNFMGYAFEGGYYMNCFHNDDITYQYGTGSPPDDYSCDRYYLGTPSVKQPQFLIVVYPNPAANQLNIQLDNVNSKVYLGLYNVLGQQVMSKLVDGLNMVTFNVSNLSAECTF